MFRMNKFKLLKCFLLAALWGGAASAWATMSADVPGRTSATLKSLFAPGTAPAGANDWSCRSSAHPVPVVLIPGTFNNMQVAFGALSPVLANAGYCVFALNYGGKGDRAYVQSIGSIEESNQKIAGFVRQVLTATGAEKVTLVGHSQGGLHAIVLSRSPEFAGKIQAVVGLAPTTHGTEFLNKFEQAGQPTLLGMMIRKVCVACEQQRENSPWVLAQQMDTQISAGVKYYVLASRNDKIILPPSRSFIQSAQAENSYVQDLCGDRRVSHRGMLYDEVTRQWLLAVLAGNQPAAEICKA